MYFTPLISLQTEIYSCKICKEKLSEQRQDQIQHLLKKHSDIFEKDNLSQDEALHIFITTQNNKDYNTETTKAAIKTNNLSFG